LFTLIVTKEAQDEIAELERTDIDAAAAAQILVQELADDQDALEYLCVPGNHWSFAPPFEVKTFQLAILLGYNIFILKYRDAMGALPGHRILVGFAAQRNTYYVLAITSRDFAYDKTHHAFWELRRRYEQCDIPIYR